MRALRRGSGDQFLERRHRIRLLIGLVPADAMDPRKTHGEAGFVACRTMHAVEGDFEDKAGLHLAYGTVAVDRVIAHPFVEFTELRIGKAGIGLADGDECALAPGAE